MGASKTRPSASPGKALTWAFFLLRPNNRGLVLTVVVVGLAIGGAIWAWGRFGESALHSSENRVTPERIVVTPQPAWIHSDVKADVVRTASLARLELRDRQLVEHVAQAFALHPWVAKVVRVEKRFPARLDVELKYRRPVAVVLVTARSESGLLFIDADGILLPTHDFASSQARDYLRIEGNSEVPAGSYGLPWGSERIAGAARLAAAWGEKWKAIGLYSIVPSAPASGPMQFELRTPAGVRVIWGSSPGSEGADEPSSEQKMAGLEQYVHDKGALDREGGPPLIDVRELLRSQVPK